MAKEKTFYLKGLAISAVLIAHYTNYYSADVYKEIEWYANGIIAIFFVLSGYGLYFSFEKRFRSGADWRKQIPLFYLDRAVKIYPYYWLALFLTPFFFPEYKLLHSVNLSSIGIYLGLPFIKAPGLFWFVTAIIQCYLLSPFLYFLLKKLRPFRYLTAILYLVTSSLTFSVLLTLWGHRNFQEDFLWNPLTVFTYRRLLLANVFLFALGMAIPTLMEFVKNKHVSQIAFYASLILFGISVAFTRYANSLFMYSDFIHGWSFDFKCLLAVPFHHRHKTGFAFQEGVYTARRDFLPSISFPYDFFRGVGGPGTAFCK